MAKIAALLFLVALQIIAGSEEDAACSAMKIKDLRALLARKGKVCEGCAEKSDFVTMCEDAKHLADVPEAERPAPAKKAARAAKAPGEEKKSIDDILASLKGMPGMEGYAAASHARHYSRSCIQRSRRARPPQPAASVSLLALACSQYQGLPAR